jgi:hypothetical protein
VADKLVVAHPDRKAQRSLQRLVAASMCPVEVVADAAGCNAATDDQTIVIVDAALANAHPELRGTPARAWIAVSGENTPIDASLVTMLLASGWDHVIAHPMPILAEEVLTTVQKLLRCDVFGLEKYMGWAAEVRTCALADARDREAAVSTVATDVRTAGLPDRVVSLVSVLADELIANALYAAPVDDAGARSHVHEARDRQRALFGRDVVTIRWATDTRYLAIEVTDRYGSIELGSIGKRLAIAGKQAATGDESGMGLALAFACCNQLVVNCVPRKRTEVIALLDVRYKPTELGRTASFHEFRG